MLTKSGVKLLDFGLAKTALAPVKVVLGDVAPDRDAARDHAAGDDPRDVPVHGARAARGQGGRRAQRHLLVRRGDLRDGDGPEGVRGEEPRRPDLGDPQGRARPGLGDRSDDASGAGPRREDVSREGPRGPVPDGPRHQAAAPVDRGRRLAGRAARPRRPPPEEPRASRVGPRGGGGRWRRRSSASASCGARRRARTSSGSRSRTRRGSRRSTRRASRRTGAPSRSTRPTRPGRAASGSGRSTPSSRSPSPAPRARRGRSGRPTAGSSRSSRKAS